MATRKLQIIFSLLFFLLQPIAATPQDNIPIFWNFRSASLNFTSLPSALATSTTSSNPRPSSTPRNFTTLDIAVFPRSPSINGSLCNITLSPEIRTVSYFVQDKWAIIDGDVIFGTEADILAAAVTSPAVGPRDLDALARRSISVFPQDPLKWPGGKILYKWGPGLDQARKDVFLEAAKIWTDRLPFLKFIESTDPMARTITGVNGSINSSPIGCCGKELRLSADLSLRWYAHEIGHTLGLYHEHQRPDRDFYIKIHCDEIQDPKDCSAIPWTGNANFFWKMSPTAANWAGPYDIESIMHYDAHSIARGDAPTITGADCRIPFRAGYRAFPTLQDSRRVCELYWEDCHNICGDGILSPQFEDCDDGNNISGDGCASNCQNAPDPACCTGLRCLPPRLCVCGLTGV